MTTETWLPVVGFPEYEVSSLGRVRSWKTGKARILRPSPDSSGYPQVNLSAGREWRASRKVHRLVSTAFLGPRPEGMVTRHLDGDKYNNCVENLRYGTIEENWQDRFRLGECRPVVACAYGHPYTATNTYNKDKGRTCRKCHARRNREYRARQRMAAVAS